MINQNSFLIRCSDRPVYPYLEIYPDVKTMISTKHEDAVKVRLEAKYPFIEICKCPMKRCNV